MIEYKKNIIKDEDQIELTFQRIKSEKDTTLSNTLIAMFYIFVLSGGIFIIWYAVNSLFLTFMILLASFLSIYLFFYRKNKENECKRNITDLNTKHKKELAEIQNKYDKLDKYCKEITEENDLIVNDLTKTFKHIAEFISDIRTVEYETFATYFETKSHPAHKKAQDVRELKQKTKEYVTQYKLMRYEYDMLFSLFPELENYLEYYSEENTKESIKEVKDNFDYVRSWVSKEEYERLDENKRNQLALDRYIESRKKSKWAIGRDYEMFIGHEFENKGYTVTYTGITERLEDKGRDLIAKKGNEILVIQCKNWSKYKVIHENHICQLFGTTTQYNIENNSLFKAIPVFVTSSTLSETALKFAEYLGVQVIQNKKLKEFPRIKCNINNKEKIYHLPFDQQYDRTIIGDQKGEFFAWTVEEAVSKGFRRAKKYLYK